MHGNDLDRRRTGADKMEADHMRENAMTSPLDAPATQLEILTTRALITALGRALVKKGVVSHSDVASELSAVIQAVDKPGADRLFIAELKTILGAVVDWGT